MLKYILKHLSVTKGDPNYEEADVLNINFSGPIPEDCPRVIQAIVDVYKEQLQGHFKNTSQETKSIFLNMKLQAEKQVREIQSRYMELLRRNGGSIVEGVNCRQQHVCDLKEELLKAETRVEELTRQVTIAKTKLIDGEDREAVLLQIMGESPTSSNQNMTRADAEERKDVNATLLDLQASRKALVHKLGQKHPDVKAIDEKIEIYKAKFPDTAAGMGFEPEPQAKTAYDWRLFLEPTPIVEDAKNYQWLFNDGLVGGTFSRKITLIRRSFKRPPNFPMPLQKLSLITSISDFSHCPSHFNRLVCNETIS